MLCLFCFVLLFLFKYIEHYSVSVAALMRSLIYHILLNDVTAHYSKPSIISNISLSFYTVASYLSVNKLESRF